MDSKTTVNEWERVKEVLVDIDAQLKAFTDQQIKYYVDDSYSVVKLSVLMLPAKDGAQARMQQLTLSKIALAYPQYDAGRITKQFIHSWITKLANKKCVYEDLDVVFAAPPSWALSKELTL